MPKIREIIHRRSQQLKDNALEVWLGLSLFAGLPFVAWLYFDFKAMFLSFFLLSSVFGIFALRNR